MPPAFKEAPPDGWKSAEPSDDVIRGPWWGVYNEPALDELEQRIDVSNQTVLAAEAQDSAPRPMPCASRARALLSRR